MDESDGSLGTDLTWSTELEDVVKNTGEQANGLAWIHKRSEIHFSFHRNFIELPVIVLSSAVGFCSVGTTSVFVGHTDVAPLVLGCLSLLVSVLNTINSYFAWSKRAEGHRIASVHYARLFRFIHIELALPREERMGPSEMLKMVRESVDRLAEISPLLPKRILREYRLKFVTQYPHVSHPPDVNGLVSISVVRAAVHVTTPRASYAVSDNVMPNKVRENESNVTTNGKLFASAFGSEGRRESFASARGTPPSPTAVRVANVGEGHGSGVES
jgi:hypothetical protein